MPRVLQVPGVPPHSLQRCQRAGSGEEDLGHGDAAMSVVVSLEAGGDLVLNPIERYLLLLVERSGSTTTDDGVL
jgi:hypothetical protein